MKLLPGTLSSLTSLTARLGLLFALIAALTFAGVGTYLYQSLSDQLEAHDDVQLVDRWFDPSSFTGNIFYPGNPG